MRSGWLPQDNAVRLRGRSRCSRPTWGGERGAAAASRPRPARAPAAAAAKVRPPAAPAPTGRAHIRIVAAAAASTPSDVTAAEVAAKAAASTPSKASAAKAAATKAAASSISATAAPASAAAHLELTRLLLGQRHFKCRTCDVRLHDKERFSDPSKRVNRSCCTCAVPLCSSLELGSQRASLVRLAQRAQAEPSAANAPRNSLSLNHVTAEAAEKGSSYVTVHSPFGAPVSLSR